MNVPLLYYEHNVYGTLNLLQLLSQYDCRRIVFSSSATVYGLAENNPLKESAPLSATSPYGRTKLVIEEILRDLAGAPVPAGESPWRMVILRYFNPIGAHPSGRIGENPMGHPNNLLPFVMQVAVGRRPELSVFGGDYQTKDGTAIRDYIHVEDLARGHVAAINEGLFGDALQGKACDVFNLGSGVGVSVLEVIAAAEKAAGKKIAHKSVARLPAAHPRMRLPLLVLMWCARWLLSLSPRVRIVGRRAGDVPENYADCSKANELLKWKVEKSLQDAVNDAWAWQSQNPYGFGEAPKESAK